MTFRSEDITLDSHVLDAHVEAMSRRDQPAYIRSWASNHGCSAEVIDELLARGADRRVLQVFLKYEAPSDTWVSLLDAGVDAPKLLAYLRGGVGEPATWARLSRGGVGPDDVDSFTKLGVGHPSDWLGLVALGVDGALAEHLTADGLETPNEWSRFALHAMMSREFSGDSAVGAGQGRGAAGIAGASPGEAPAVYLSDRDFADFMDAGVRHSLDCLRYAMLGVRGAQARDLTHAGFPDPADWVRAAELGLTAEDLGRMGRTGFAQALRGAGPTHN